MCPSQTGKSAEIVGVASAAAGHRRRYIKSRPVPPTRSSFFSSGFLFLALLGFSCFSLYFYTHFESVQSRALTMWQSALTTLGLLAASASTANAGSLKDIKHIVLFMQENRAFDHVSFSFFSYISLDLFEDARVFGLGPCNPPNLLLYSRLSSEVPSFSFLTALFSMIVSGKQISRT